MLRDRDQLLPTLERAADLQLAGSPDKRAVRREDRILRHLGRDEAVRDEDRVAVPPARACRAPHDGSFGRDGGRKRLGGLHRRGLRALAEEVG